MNDTQIRLVKDTWRVLHNKESVIHDFYAHLFALNPSLMKLFKRNQIMQGRKIFSMLDYVISNLDNRDKYLPALTSSGSRHPDYGVKLEDFYAFKDALINTLIEHLIEDFTDEIREAWLTVYIHIQDVMCTAIVQKQMV